MAIVIRDTAPNSPAQKLHIEPGSLLVSVNGHEINDLLDYGFYTAEKKLKLVVQDAVLGETKEYVVRKREEEELGFESDSFLMDGEQSCKNKCVFCFIDQLPDGLRDTLYFKDDDERLSFLFGNYITLTNLTDKDIQRIIDMKISPVNISVHTTNEQLRCEMMGNRIAGEKLQHLYRLAAAGTEINCQIVLCRGVNDGDELKNTLKRLTGLYPAVRSIAVVPVGLTKHRQGLAQLEPYDKESALAVLDIIDAVQRDCRAAHDVGLVYPADEWLLLAGRNIPDIDYYDDLNQLENGVGMLALTRDEFEQQLDDISPTDNKLDYTMLTGELAAPSMRVLAEKAKEKAPGLACNVIAVRNDFFGGNVSVSGLVTATDIVAQVDKNAIKGTALIPANMLRREGDMFLDSVTVEQLSDELGCAILVVQDGAELAQVLTGNMVV